MSITVTTPNAEEVQKILEELAPRHAYNISRATNYGVAGVVRDEIKRTAPSEPDVSEKRRLLRTIKGKEYGPLKRSVKAKRKRTPRGEKPKSVVTIDAFYWRFLEDGTPRMAPQPFVNPVVERLRARLPQIWKEQFGKKLAAALRREAKKAARK